MTDTYEAVANPHLKSEGRDIFQREISRPVLIPTKRALYQCRMNVSTTLRARLYDATAKRMIRDQRRKEDPKKVNKPDFCLWSIYIQCEAFVRALGSTQITHCTRKVGNQPPVIWR